MTNKICGIYCIENLVNRKRYIGQSIDIEKRINRHKRELNSNKSPSKILQNAWNKYGEESFKFYIIEECTSKELDYREIFFIKTMNSHNSENGYNISWGGNAPMKNVIITEEHRKKLSIANSGKNNAMYGKKTPKSVLEKISKALLGRKQSESEKFNNSYGQVGIKKRKITSNYVGVNMTSDGHFISRIQNVYTKERIYLGYFLKETDAAIAYDEKCWELYRDKTKLNFPDNYR